MNDQFNSGMKAGTAGGTLLVFIANIQPNDLLKTGILAMTGSVVSFGISLLLQRLVQWRRRRRRSDHTKP